MIAKKAPESQHYSGSGSLSSLSFRVAAAIAQKNGERDFIVEVIPNALAITTSKLKTYCLRILNTFHKIQKLSKQDQLPVTRKTDNHKTRISWPYPRQQTQQTSRQAKLHRLRPKEDRQSSLVLSKLHEGTTYETSVDFAVSSERQEKLVAEIQRKSTSLRKLKPVAAQMSHSTLIVQDLETTGFCKYFSRTQLYWMWNVVHEFTFNGLFGSKCEFL